MYICKLLLKTTSFYKIYLYRVLILKSGGKDTILYKNVYYGKFQHLIFETFTINNIVYNYSTYTIIIFIRRYFIKTRKIFNYSNSLIVMTKCVHWISSKNL